MKKILSLMIVVSMIFTLSACSKSNKKDKTEKNEFSTVNQTGNSSSQILIAYFSRMENVEEPEKVDAISSASLFKKDGKKYGNVQYLANLIQKSTKGDLFSIEAKNKYSATYDTTFSRAEQEKDNEERPALSSNIYNLGHYTTIYLGFPNWWYDMPMALYSFLDTYDFSGKTIIPFCSSGGDGFSDTISKIQAAEPNATVIPNGFTVTHSKVDQCTFEEVDAWIQGLGLGQE